MVSRVRFLTVIAVREHRAEPHDAAWWPETKALRQREQLAACGWRLERKAHRQSYYSVLDEKQVHQESCSEPELVANHELGQSRRLDQ